MEDQGTISPPHEEKNMMQTNGKSSYFCIPLYHDEFDTNKEVKIRFKQVRFSLYPLEDITKILIGEDCATK